MSDIKVCATLQQFSSQISLFLMVENIHFFISHSTWRFILLFTSLSLHALFLHIFILFNPDAKMLSRDNLYCLATRDPSSSARA